MPDPFSPLRSTMLESCSPLSVVEGRTLFATRVVDARVLLMFEPCLLLRVVEGRALLPTRVVEARALLATKASDA
jgi:hypothetical protein